MVHGSIVLRWGIVSKDVTGERNLPAQEKERQALREEKLALQAQQQGWFKKKKQTNKKKNCDFKIYSPEFFPLPHRP